jgi:SAM-dependent methyltransferase
MEIMDRLTDKDYWESLYQGDSLDFQPRESKMGRLLRGLLGHRLFDMLSAYDDYLLWQSVLPKYLPERCSTLKALEIGSAPGDFMVRFAKTFDVIPFGLEYTSHGAELNRRIFEVNGLNPDGVIEADFFSDEFLSHNKGRFDIVISRGFIEHFSSVESVVERHVALLNDGGLLIILIPNLRGIYYPWTKKFNPAQLPLHNLELMKEEAFRFACEVPEMVTYRCGYFGTFSFWMFTAPSEATSINRVIRMLHIIQRGLNFLMRIVFGGNGCESSKFSPNLIYIGQKKVHEN